MEACVLIMSGGETGVRGQTLGHESASVAMRSIPVDAVRAFVAVVEARGFTRAAEGLGRSQPTISLQVKRLEELVEAPLFERATRFELTGVGSACFEFGKRLLREHDAMLAEVDRRKSPEARLRVGMAGEFAARLTPRLRELCSGKRPEVGFEVVTEASESLVAAFRRNALDVAVVVGAEPERDAECWRARLRWFGESGAVRSRKESARIVVPGEGSAIHEAAVGALRAQGRSFEVVCASADFAVLTAAAAAGIGVAPMIEGLAPVGLRPSADKSLPALAPVAISLLAGARDLAEVGRRLVAGAVDKLQPL
jgi:DNA-binding transcriptional LysR family regulator